MKRKNITSSYSSGLFSLGELTNHIIVVSAVFSCVLLFVRILYTGRITFIFLLWNLFLAFVPYCISHFLCCQRQWQRKYSFFFFFIAWLVFIPNSFYVLTDLFHLSDRYNDYRVPQWFDLALILSFAWNSLLFGVLSMRVMEKILFINTKKRYTLCFIYPMMWLNAFGIYIGRYLRYNSWDIIMDPLHLSRDIAHTLFHPFIYRNAVGMIGCYSILLTLIYITLKKISQIQ